MQAKNIICLVVDRLQAPLLGPYGNTWIETPELNHLATESFLFDRAVTDTLSLELVYRGFWQGLPAIWPAQAGPPSFAALAKQAGWHTALLTDEPLVAQLPTAADFAERTLLEWPPAESLAGDVGETQAAQFAAAASDWLAEPRAPFFLWLHTRGLAAAWDAPYALREQVADEEDPPPPDFVAPPCQRLPDDYDPDTLLGITQACAGQVNCLDTCLGALVDQLRGSQLAANTLLVLLSPRGFALGEHHRVGPIDSALYNENVQIAWMMRYPDGLGALGRSQALVLPADLPPTLAAWLDWPPERLAGGGHNLLPLVHWEAQQVRECAVLTSAPDEWALRTPAWHLRAVGHGDTRTYELFSKPSDRFEVNDVADRAADVVSGLTAALDQALADPTAELKNLEPALVAELD